MIPSDRYITLFARDNAMPPLKIAEHLYCCPACNQAVTSKHGRDGQRIAKFCQNCGKRLDWSVYDD